MVYGNSRTVGSVQRLNKEQDTVSEKSKEKRDWIFTEGGEFQPKLYATFPLLGLFIPPIIISIIWWFRPDVEVDWAMFSIDLFLPSTSLLFIGIMSYIHFERPQAKSG